jgi:hypothetical protein
MQNELMDASLRKAPLTVGAVLAVWLQNAGGGIGALVAVGVVAWLLGADAGTGLRWAVAAGGLLFAGLMVLRSAIDEIVDWSDWRAILADLEALEEQNDLLEQQVARLRRDLASAETYGAYRAARPGVVVQDRNGDPMPAPAPTPIRNDAKRLIQLHFEQNEWPAKDRTCRNIGWTTTRWEEARDELERHGVIVTRGRQTIVLAETLATALAMLAGDVER